MPNAQRVRRLLVLLLLAACSGSAPCTLVTPTCPALHVEPAAVALDLTDAAGARTVAEVRVYGVEPERVRVDRRYPPGEHAGDWLRIAGDYRTTHAPPLRYWLSPADGGYLRGTYHATVLFVDPDEADTARVRVVLTVR